MNIQTKGDLIAIPFFILVLYYVYNTKPNYKYIYLRYISIVFLICTIIADSYFVFYL